MYATESLGVGVSVPTSNLEVVGNAYVSSNLEIGTANLFVDTTTGNVGIGTVSPRDVEHIWKDGSNGDHGLLIEQNNAGTGSATLKFGVAHTTESTTGLSKAGIFFRRADTKGRGDLLFCMDNADDTNDVDTSNHAMTIYRDGNVGIGTVSPDSIFHTYSGAGADEVWVDEWKHSFDANWNFRLSQKHDHGLSVEYGFKQRYSATEYTPLTFRGNRLGIFNESPDYCVEIGPNGNGTGTRIKRPDGRNVGIRFEDLNLTALGGSTRTATDQYQFILSAPRPATTGNGLTMFINSANRTADGGASCATIRNDDGPIRLGNAGQNTILTGSKVGVGEPTTGSPPAKLSVHTSGAVSLGSAWNTTDFVVSAFNNSTIANSLGVAIGNNYVDNASGLGYIWCMRPNLSWNDLHMQHRKLLVRCIGGDAYFNTGILWSNQTTLSTNKKLQGPNNVTTGALGHHWSTYSARYLKENIELSLNCLDKVKALRAVNYTWKSGQGDNVTPNEEYEHTHLLTGPQTHIGFIADEVAEVLPEVCTFDPDGVASSLDYARITPVLVNAVKELDEKIGKGENSSDDRLKDNETYVRNATATIMKLKPQVYDKRESFLSNVYTREAGLIAQDIWYDAPELRFAVKPGLMSQIPEEVPLRSNDPRVDPDYSKWGPNPASVEYNNLIPYAIKSIQELSTELPRCKTQITGVTPANVDGHRGLIVSAKTNEMHLGAPVLSLSTEAKDKKCFGVISYSNTYSTDNEFLVDTTGCGQVWVSNSSPIESGDYLTSSSVTGYAMKQDDDLLHNYTIGKALHGCDFNPTQKPKRRVVQELSTVTYYTKTTLYPITEDRYNELDDSYRFSKEHAFYKKTENVQVPEKNGYDNVEYVHNTNEDESVLSPEQWAALDANTQSTYHASYSNVMSLVQVSLEDYTKLNESEREGLTLSSKTLFYYKLREESTDALPGYEEETRNEYIDVLDEHGQIQWEDDPSGAVEPEYEIRYLTADGQITDESNAVHTAALVACTYHCG